MWYEFYCSNQILILANGWIGNWTLFLIKLSSFLNIETVFKKQIDPVLLLLIGEMLKV